MRAKGRVEELFFSCTIHIEQFEIEVSTHNEELFVNVKVESLFLVVIYFNI